MEGLAGRYDAIVTPSMSTVALPLTARLSRARQPDICQALGALANLAGIPAISLPNGFGARGLPTGLRARLRRAVSGRATTSPA